MPRPVHLMKREKKVRCSKRYGKTLIFRTSSYSAPGYGKKKKNVSPVSLWEVNVARFGSDHTLILLSRTTGTVSLRSSQKDLSMRREIRDSF